MRLLSPIGFLVAALCFLLPFVTAPWSVQDGAQGVTSATVTYTGVDLITGGRPAIEATTWTSVPARQQALGQLAERIGPVEVQPLAVIALTLLVAGVAVAVARHPWRRALAGTAIAVAAAVLIAGGVSDTYVGLRAELVGRFSGVSGRPVLLEEVGLTVGYGFWLAFALLLALAVWNLIPLVREARTAYHAAPLQSISRTGESDPFPGREGNRGVALPGPSGQS